MASLLDGNRLNQGIPAKLSNGIRVNTDLAKRGPDLSRGPGMAKQAIAAAWSNTWPAPGATLDLDFANNRGFVRGVGQGGAMDAVTFTRASNGTFVGSNGLLAGSGSDKGALGLNLLTFPQDFDNAAWLKNGVTVTANTGIAPDDTQTTDSLFETAVNQAHSIRQAFTTGAQSNYALTFSVYVKPNGRDWCAVQVTDTGSNYYFAYVNLSTGATGTTGSAGTSSNSVTVTADKNGFYRVVIKTTFTSIASVVRPEVLCASADNVATYVGDVTKGIFIWGAQLELGSTATTYYPTNINAPRFDWASTAVTANRNILTYTEQFDNSVWIKNSATVTANAISAPDGSLTADLLTATGSGANAQYQIGFPAGIYTISVYAKRGNSDWFALSNGGFFAYFNISTGTVGTVGDGTASVVDVGGGWYRCVWVPATASSNGTLRIRCAVANGNTSTTTENAYIWGAQIEAGTSLSSYQAIGAQSPTNTPLAAASTCNGLLIEESRTNRLLWCRSGSSGTGQNAFTYSQTFNNAAWVATATTLTLGITDPSSGTTAATLLATSANATFYQTQTLNNAPYTVSFYVQRVLGSGPISFTLDGTNFTDISAPTGSWVRYSVTATPAAGARTIGIRIATLGDSINIAFAQLNIGAVLTDYQVTTSSALFGWSKSNATVAQNQTGIDGAANAATSITASAANAVLIQPISLASGSRTSSVYLKRITGTGNVQVSLDGSTWSTVDLSNGLWNRIVLSGTVTNPVVGIRLATNGDAVAMDYGQVEDGANATSPVLTTGATATRSSDIASLSTSVISRFINQFRGIWTCTFNVYSSGALSVNPRALSQGQTQNAQGLIVINSTGLASVFDGSNVLSDRAYVAGTFATASMFYDQYKKSISLNGGVAGYGDRATSFPLTPVNYVVIGAATGSSNFVNGAIKRVYYVPGQGNQTSLSVSSSGAT